MPPPHHAAVADNQESQWSRKISAAVSTVSQQDGAAKEEHEEDRDQEEHVAGQGLQVPLLQPRQGRGVHHVRDSLTHVGAKERKGNWKKNRPQHSVFVWPNVHVE